MRTPPGNPPRLLRVDALKTVSLYSVALIHSAAPLLEKYTAADSGLWWAGNLYNSAARWCIPAFFMISGSFLIGEAGRTGPVSFLRHRLDRIGIPFLAWSAVYFAWNVEVNHTGQSYPSFFLLVLTQPAFYHLWFLYVLAGMYLAAPILSVYTLSASPRNQAYFLLFWFLFGSLLPTVESLSGISLFFITGSHVALFRYTGFFILGHLIRVNRISRLQRRLALPGILLGLSVTILGTYRTTVVGGAGTFNGTFYEYYSPNVVLMAVSLYILALKAGMPFRKRFRGMAGIVMSISACVPGMYLVHPLVISVLKRGMAGFYFDQNSLSPVTGVPLFALAVSGISFFITAAMRATPLLRRIVP